MMKRIRIRTAPPGEAPQTIRNAWIGVVIPLPAHPYDKACKRYGVGVLTGPKGFLGQLWALITGKCFTWEAYTVDALTAVEALAKTKPESARWWRESTPHLMRPGMKLMFPANVCEPDE